MQRDNRKTGIDGGDSGQSVPSVPISNDEFHSRFSPAIRAVTLEEQE